MNSSKGNIGREKLKNIGKTRRKLRNLRIQGFFLINVIFYRIESKIVNE